MENCCLFNEKEEEFENAKDFTVIKNYGAIDAPDDGTRSLLRCNRCGGLFLYQWLEWNDCYYNDYIQVKNEEEADELNKKYGWFNFSSSNHPMIKVGSNKVVTFRMPK